MSHNVSNEIVTEHVLSGHILVDRFTKEKIRKHLSDQTDVITEEDIKNIRTDIFIDPASFLNRYISK